MPLNKGVRVADEDVDLAAETFAPLAGPMHIRIILLLRGAERSSGELAELTGRSPAAVS
ncbi:hypothetical protein [Actinomyces sp. oral taxon 448]|jgi:hypothetical protein|uniref:hypothetical protein n=1 Tax=Actinomyces sp. oral taxon 448 TaxID=712124 RepID=UPI0025BF13CC|nr:hypothetical protein [Actinomyces sp. oral taxon 448]